MSETSADFDVREQLARIQLAQEEARKFASEQHKLAAETLKLGAEAAKLHRDRLLAPLVVVASLVGGAIAASIGWLARVH